MVKAQIVAALKAMTSNLTYGDRVAHILNQNPVWAEYRDQKHDLFITDTNVRGYLTGTIEVLTKMQPLYCFFFPLFLRSSQHYRWVSDPGASQERRSADFTTAD